MTVYSPKLVQLVLCVCCLLVIGCGKPVGTVSGQVTLDGKPLPSGAVTFANQNMQVWQGMVVDGKYQVDDIDVGSMRITVISYPPTPKMPEATGTEVAPLKYFEPDLETFAVPKKYGDVDKSGLAYDVAEGPQTHDIALVKKTK